MIGKRFFALLALLFLCQLETSGALPMNASQGFRGLELSIQTQKTKYVMGEPVNLQIALRNTGNDPINMSKFFMLPSDDADKNNLEIQVNDLDGKRIVRIGHVMTGRAIHYPDINTIEPGETYRDSIQIAGTFKKSGRKHVEQALWSFGENPEVTSVNEYPSMTHGTFRILAVYRVSEQHLTGLGKEASSSVWKGQLISNTIEVSIE